MVNPINQLILFINFGDKMSKKAKSKNSIIKKAKKLERQGKYLKALKVCDSYLDIERAEESLILLKIDILVNLYNNDDFINKINTNKVKITDFIEKSEEEELLKLYNTLDNYLELNSQNMNDDSKVGSYLAGGLLVDNLETILVLNEMAKDNKKENKEPLKVDLELKDFIENVKKTCYQYLGLILPNYAELINSSNFNFEKIIEKIRHFIDPNESVTEEKVEKEEKTSEIDTAAQEEMNSADEETPKTSYTDEKETDTSKEDSSEENTLKLEDTTELSPDYSVEDEIKGLKEIITYLNDKNEFKKALIYQRRLVKLAREENIKAEEEHDSKQKTLNDY